MASRFSRSAAMAAVLVVAGQLAVAHATLTVPTASAQATTTGPCTSLRTLPGLQSITIYEVSGNTTGDPYLFSANDPRLAEDMDEISAAPGELDLYTPGPKENYDIFYGNADGTFNPNGRYIVIQAYRNLPGAVYADAANNIDAVLLTFANGQNYYVDSIGGYRVGTNPLNGGQISGALGAPDTNFTSGVFTRLGNGSTFISVGFNNAFSAAQSSQGCQANSNSSAAQCITGTHTLTVLAGDKDGFGVGLPLGANYPNLNAFTPDAQDPETMDRFLVSSAWQPSVFLNYLVTSPYVIKPVPFTMDLSALPAGAVLQSASITFNTADIDDGAEVIIDDKLTIDGVDVPNAFNSTNQYIAGVAGRSGLTTIPLNAFQLQQQLADRTLSILVDEPTRNGRVFQDGQEASTEILAIDYAELKLTYTVTCPSSSSASSASSAATRAQCSDGVDNADPEDTLADFNDPGCYTGGIYNPDDNDETDRFQCSDGVDNADPEDTLADFNDPGCYTGGIYNPNDNDETNAASSASSSSVSSVSSSSASSALPQCRDGQDNDGDGAIDYPSDFSCSNPDDNDETNPKAQCQDGFDNVDSEDTLADAQDPGCHFDGNPNNPNSYNPQDNDEFNAVASSSASSAVPQCRDNIDNDGDGAIDYPSDFSCSGPDDNDETNPKAQCQDGQDNDGDGKVDSQDPGCHFDGNPGNPNSYNPQDNDEFNVASSAPFVPQCRDNIDNDGDGAIDYPSDFSCSHPDDNDETTPKAQCQDGVDNDGDGKVDFPQDPGCMSLQDNDEFNAASSASSALPQCRDGIDNDGDGAIDYPSDFSCSGPDDNDETNPKAQCQDGQDNDGDRKVDSQDPGCHWDGNPGNSNSYNPQDNDEFNALSSSSASSAVPQCRDNVDNDGDGATDYPSDFSCSHPDDNDETNPKAQCQDGYDNDGDGLVDANDPGCHFDGNAGNPNSYNKQDNDEFNQASSSSAASSAPSAGCILVLNETFDTQGHPIYQAAAQFTYALDGNQTAVNNASGIARFDNVTPGSHTISQQMQSAWTNLSITPMGGTVQVSGGPICAAVIFKNKQNSVGGQSSSVYNPYYQPDPYAYGSGKNEKMCRSLSDKYGDRYASSKKRKKLPKAIKKLMDDCDDDFGNAAWWLN